MIIKLTKQEKYTIAEFVNLERITLPVVEKVKIELKPVLSQPNSKFVLDFKNIMFIDSSGIGCIISLIKTAKSNGSEIKLCNLRKEVRDVFDLLHLEMILDIEEDEKASIKSFSN